MGVIVTMGEAFYGAPLFIIVGAVLFIHGLFNTGREMIEQPNGRDGNVDVVICC